MAGRLADGFGIVVERLELLEQALEGLFLAAGEGEFAGGEFLERRHGLEEGGGRRDHDKRVGCGRERAGGAEAGKYGHALAGGGEGLAHVAAVAHGLGKNQGVQRTRTAGSGGEERDILGELFGGLQVLGHDEPDGRAMGARKFRDDRAAGRRADAGQLVTLDGRDRHEREGGSQETRKRKPVFSRLPA